MRSGDAGWPAWIGPLHCDQCRRAGTLRLTGDDNPALPEPPVRCTACGWRGGLWAAEQRTLEEAVADAYGRRRAADRIPPGVRIRASPPPVPGAQTDPPPPS